MKSLKEEQHSTDPLRIIFLADTHLGFDLPFRPRIQRRRRGPEFFDNFQKVLDGAVAWKADCIIHGGDLFYRSKIPPALVEMVFDRLKKVADKGIPIVIVPGNHERSRIPHSELSFHPNLHIFTRPQTFRLNAKGRTVAISGFPFVSENIRERAPAGGNNPRIVTCCACTKASRVPRWGRGIIHLEKERMWFASGKFHQNLQQSSLVTFISSKC